MEFLSTYKNGAFLSLKSDYTWQMMCNRNHSYNKRQPKHILLMSPLLIFKSVNKPHPATQAWQRAAHENKPWRQNVEK